MVYLGQMVQENLLLLNILGSLVKKDTGNIKICGIDIDKNLKMQNLKLELFLKN